MAQPSMTCRIKTLAAGDHFSLSSLAVAGSEVMAACRDSGDKGDGLTAPRLPSGAT